VLLADLVRRQIAVLATPGTLPTRAAKAATSTIPIVFGVAEKPVELGLVGSFARPGGSATGINFLATEMVAKRLRLLHDTLPMAVRIAVLVNRGNTKVADSTAREVQEAAATMGLQIRILNATTGGEIDAAFATFASERPDALLAHSGHPFWLERPCGRLGRVRTDSIDLEGASTCAENVNVLSI